MLSPGHQQSTGKAESHVKIFKRMLQRTSAEHQDQWLALLELRNTPRQDIHSNPAQVLFEHATRSVIPVRIPKCDHYDHVRRQSRRTAVKHKHARPMSPLNIHQRVLFQSPAKKGWEHGIISHKLSDRSYFVKSNSGACYRRNRVHLRSDKSDNFECDNFDITHPIFRNTTTEHNVIHDSNARTRPTRERRPPSRFNDFVM